MSDLIPRHLEHLEGAGKSPRTVADRKRLLEHADACLPYGLDEAHYDEIAAYLANSAWSTWTRSTYWSHLRGYYRWAVKVGELTLDPMGLLDRPPAGECLPDPVTDDELALALHRSPAQPWGMAIMLAAYAGLRCCELVRLRREDVTVNDLRVRVGKGRRAAVIPTSPILWAYLQGRPRGLLVTSVTGLAMSAHYLASNQRRLHWERIGLAEVHLHRFRHWYGTTLLRLGADLRTVQELMRHRSIISTQGYTLIVSEQRSQAIATLPSVTHRPAAAMNTRTPASL